MGFATSGNSKSVRRTNSIFTHKKDIGVTIEKMQKKKFQNFGVIGFAKWSQKIERHSLIEHHP